MELFTFQDVPAFSAAVAPFLARHEAENNLMLGIIDFGIKNPAAASDWEMAAVMDGGEPVLAALRTPPQNLIVAGEGAEADALALLAAHYAGKPLPGVIGPSALAQAFASLLCSRQSLTGTTSWLPVRKKPQTGSAALPPTAKMALFR